MDKQELQTLDQESWSKIVKQQVNVEVVPRMLPVQNMDSRYSPLMGPPISLNFSS